MPSVLITGAGKGFGRELLIVFYQQGWIVFPLVRRSSQADELNSSLGKNCFPIIADVTAASTTLEITRVLQAHTTSLDVLINNAGNIKKLRGLENTFETDLKEHFQVHCVGALRCVKAALPFIRQSPRAIIINITSRWGSIGRTISHRGCGIYAYQIAKCAQNMLTACLDQDLKNENIRVFAVHPGRLKTEVASEDADIEPIDAARKLFFWLQSVNRDTVCGCHDLMGGGLIDW
jgi:NAD(P)-dependent dehydrogenase (short-subunit alcohol dehydrogenase family)